jgi:hypothetical protein
MNKNTAVASYNAAIRALTEFTNKLEREELRAQFVVAGVAAKVYELVKMRYRAYGRPSTSSFSYAAARRGKERSGSQRVPPVRARLPLRGATAELVGVQALANFVEKKGEKLRYRVYISPIAIRPDGKKWEDIAGWLEDPPATIQMRETLWSLAYRIMIQEGRGGYGTRKSTRAGLPLQNRGIHVRHPKAYPVFSKVAADVAAKVVPKVADDVVGRWLEKNVRMLLNRGPRL